MGSRFSKRYGYDPAIPTEPVVQDAPGALRFGFINGILDDLTYIDRDSRYPNPERRPFGVKALGQQLCVLFREEPDSSLDDSWRCWDALKSLLRQCEWYRFYDAVERIGELIQEAERQFGQGAIRGVTSECDPAEWAERFGFEAYRANVNDLFADLGVVWRLNTESRLEREMPEELAQAVDAVEASLADTLEPAHIAFKKARRFLTGRPLDPENAIKEIVSAVESVGRSLYPGATTLGDVVRVMRRASFPPLMATVIEKFYAFASAEPGVRHGGTTTSRVELADADFCLQVGTALIRYLIEVCGRQAEETRIAEE